MGPERTVRVILVSQDTSFVNYITTCLAEIKQVTLVRCGKSADEAIHIYHKVLPDVLIIDLHFSGKSACFAIYKIIRQYKNFSIIVAAESFPYFYLKKLARLGVLGYISKKSTPAEIARAIDIILQKKPYFAKDIVSSVFNAKEKEESVLFRLTKGEFEIAYMVLQKKSRGDIAQELNILPNSVTDRKRILYKKIGITNDDELLILAKNENLI